MEKTGGRNITFVEAEDEITGDSEIDLRVVLSCGHKAAPESVIQWCLTQLHQGKTVFSCPAPTADSKTCNKEWPFEEIQNISLQTEEDMKQCEETLAYLTAKQFCDFKQCPGCSTNVERKHMYNLQVCCLICTSMYGRSYTFCWQCLKPWRGGNTSAVRCNNEGCKDHRLDILENCKLIALPSSNIKNCPSIRACTTCGLLIEHKAYCKYILCKQCSTHFCFVCLETAENCKRTKENASYLKCFKRMAPRQTVVPVWSKQIVPAQSNTERNADAAVHRRLPPQNQQLPPILPQPQLQPLPQQLGQQQLPQLPGQRKHLLQPIPLLLPPKLLQLPIPLPLPPMPLQQPIPPPVPPKPAKRLWKPLAQQEGMEDPDKQEVPKQPDQQPLAEKNEKPLLKRTDVKQLIEKLQQLRMNPGQQQLPQQQLVTQPEQQNQRPLSKQPADPAFMQELQKRLKKVPGDQMQ